MSDPYRLAVDSLTTRSVDGRHVQKRIGEISAVDTYAAKRVSDGLETLILEVDTNALGGIQDWPSSRGFEVVPAPTAKGSGGRTRVYLQLLEERYREVFRSLCGDVCSVIAGASAQTEAIRLFRQRLLHWRSFLQKHGPDGLGEDARCGLFGELLILRDLLLPRMGPETVVRAWRGCKKANQDFQFRGGALEVKTTRATIPDRISVSNVLQLDDQGMKHMFLTVVHVHENETAGETLPELVERLRSAVADDVRDALNAGLEEVGYSDAHRELYSRTRYQRIALYHFQVRDGFPRLARHHVPDGVKSVHYDVSFDACKPFGTDEAAVLELLVQGNDDDHDG